MSDDQFTKLFGYMEKRFSEIEEKLDRKAEQSSIDQLQQTIDKFIARLDEQEIELRARDGQFEKLLSWARKVSEKTGIPLENL